MVEQIRGYGRHHRDVIDEVVGRDRTAFRLIRFRQGDGYRDPRNRETLALRELRRLPDFDQKSLHFVDVSETDGTQISVLLVPDDCPDLLPKSTTSGEIPKEGETWVVEVSKLGSVSTRMIAVLVDNKASALNIARREASEMYGCYRRNIQAQAKLVSPEEFIEALKELVRRGVNLRDRFLRFADLRAYQEEVQQSRRVSRK